MEHGKAYRLDLTKASKLAAGKSGAKVNRMNGEIRDIQSRRPKAKAKAYRRQRAKLLAAFMEQKRIEAGRANHTIAPAPKADKDELPGDTSGNYVTGWLTLTTN